LGALQHQALRQWDRMLCRFWSGGWLDMAAAYRQLRLTYHPKRQLVSAAACPKLSDIGK